ncbi:MULTISPECIES: NmrA family transcriptional regulator [Aeromicrobium]|uniref:NmrA family transcriptional regulator n=1 Tax=Aeromicrobium yanjiei TaxID=2662028 RepID=A0A5Q2MFR0_9ACTN|nr:MULTISPECIES: NmrA family transcriptional regulator [Aeromicrobium]MRK01787.1 NmrA family transcriptional regulator [Aeromicrobium sp. S22]QGG41468.1 NmrA family transcriptional regulator [Aeromicrobium yanjiei]
MTSSLTAVLSGTGKTGQRVVARLTALGAPVRSGSRAGTPRFDWADESTWPAALEDVSAAYLAYHPDMAAPGAAEAVGTLSKIAADRGVEQLVLLSGRGEEDGWATEQAVRDSGLAWTILRSSWFSQNFSESFMLDSVLAGELVLPTGAVTEPFVDADDLADAAVAALTRPEHEGRTYELTGPRLLTFGDAVEEIAHASHRQISYVPVSTREFAAGLAEQAVPPDLVEFLTHLFTKVLDGRNSHLTGDLEQILGRPPRDFHDYATATAATGVWAAGA